MPFFYKLSESTQPDWYDAVTLLIRTTMEQCDEYKGSPNVSILLFTFNQWDIEQHHHEFEYIHHGRVDIDKAMEMVPSIVIRFDQSDYDQDRVRHKLVAWVEKV